jgi:hypothetical protein
LHAKTIREAASIHHDSASSAADILNARTKHIEAVDKLHTNRVGALAGAHHDLAAAFQKRVAGMMAARRPVSAPPVVTRCHCRGVWHDSRCPMWCYT